MSTRKHAKLVREGDWLAEVTVDLIESSESLAPYLSLDDARKLDGVRLALRRGDLAAARKHARVRRLTPVPADAVQSFDAVRRLSLRLISPQVAAIMRPRGKGAQ